jgi:hypothetical protein
MASIFCKGFIVTNTAFFVWETSLHVLVASHFIVAPFFLGHRLVLLHDSLCRLS